MPIPGGQVTCLEIPLARFLEFPNPRECQLEFPKTAGVSYGCEQSLCDLVTVPVNRRWCTVTPEPSQLGLLRLKRCGGGSF